MTEISESMRRVAFGAAYRMLGTVADAEDVAQSAIERMLRLPPAERPRNVEAWLTTVATRLAIDQLRSARARREEYVGEWFPEPLDGSSLGAEPDISGHAELAEELSFAFLVLLETLTPSERAAFLLHDVLDYSYDGGGARSPLARSGAQAGLARPRSGLGARAPLFGVDEEATRTRHAIHRRRRVRCHRAVRRDALDRCHCDL
ncbi:hypothetical protein ET475_15765 [Microbacterium protaetiae]|uniref:RNA polymerase sigma-70 region 2 domain-containing protein n=1 Tax=Microbacterium protaetiae TaxID=2509458 RepID=A0A4V0YDN1_9MICO|nr:sigma factor [Microbacterium protaetiae]QAY61291.1 hypothetical protein ET475_15765 [Microbacterium protaetiae]